MAIICTSVAELASSAEDAKEFTEEKRKKSIWEVRSRSLYSLCLSRLSCRTQERAQGRIREEEAETVVYNRSQMPVNNLIAS